MDSRKAVPACSRRHLDHCRACRQAAVALERVHHRLQRERPDILEHVPADLARRMDAALPARWSEQRFMFTRTQVLQAAAAAVILVAVFVSVTSLHRSAPVQLARADHAASATSQPAIERLSASGNLFIEASRQAESPMHQEMEYLQKHAEDTGRFIMSCLDLKLKP
jgi:hypothetical protein